jgi:hypothetical protein
MMEGPASLLLIDFKADRPMQEFIKNMMDVDPLDERTEPELLYGGCEDETSARFGPAASR